MTKIEKSIEIFKSPEEVFSYLKELDRMPEWMSTCKSHEITSDKRYGVGVTTHYVAEHGGKIVEWDSTVTEWEENRKIAWKCEEPSKNTGMFILEPSPNGTKVTLIMEYEIPIPLLGGLIDKLVVSKSIERGIQEGLNNLKNIIEGK